MAISGKRRKDFKDVLHGFLTVEQSTTNKRVIIHAKIRSKTRSNDIGLAFNLETAQEIGNYILYEVNECLKKRKAK